MDNLLPEGLIRAVFEQYTLPLSGVHGPAHWARVWENGIRLSRRTGADPEVVGLFAILHDSRRFNEGRDPRHGSRAAHFAKSLRGVHLFLDRDKFDLLSEACSFHTNGLIEADITVQTCWDSDRLDLGRVGITPDPVRLCTDAARGPELIAWATRMARTGFRPPLMDSWK